MEGLTFGILRYMNKTLRSLITGAVTYKSFSLQSLSHISTEVSQRCHNYMYNWSLKRVVARRASTVSHSILQRYNSPCFSLGAMN